MIEILNDNSRLERSGNINMVFVFSMFLFHHSYIIALFFYFFHLFYVKTQSAKALVLMIEIVNDKSRFQRSGDIHMVFMFSICPFLSIYTYCQLKSFQEEKGSKTSFGYYSFWNLELGLIEYLK